MKEAPTPQECKILAEGLSLLKLDIIRVLATMMARNNEAVVCDTFRTLLQDIDNLKGRLES